MRLDVAASDRTFARLVESHRGELRIYCRRMLRSHEDAEDALQETLIRAWRGLPAFEGRGSVRAWLYRIATNAAIDTVKSRRRAVRSVDTLAAPLTAIERVPDAAPLPDETYEQREAAQRALEVAAQLLPPGQRAVLILREALGLSAAETAGALDRTVVSVNSALQRARATIEAHSDAPVAD
jgi:RNA polymerase sigma-70 factor, ECF subfamily